MEHTLLLHRYRVGGLKNEGGGGQRCMHKGNGEAGDGCCMVKGTALVPETDRPFWKRGKLPG